MLRAVRALAPLGPELEPLVQKMRSFGVIQTADLGLGIERTSILTLGGYVRCEIVVASDRARLLSDMVVCSAELDAPATTGPLLERLLGGEFGRRPSENPKHFTAVAKSEFSASTAKARGELDRELGPLTAVEPPLERLDPLESAYRTLMSPLEALVIGSRCGVAAQPPRGRPEITILRNARRTDLLRNVLRGSNPAARVYAKRALVELAAVSPADQTTIDRLAALPISMQACSGCTSSTISSKAAFRASDD